MAIEMRCILYRYKSLYMKFSPLLSGIFFCLCVLHWQSCKKKIYDCSTPTVKRSLDIAFVGYTTSELDTIAIRVYTEEGTFSNLQSSSVYTPTPYTSRQDTIFYQWSFPIIDGQDYELEVKQLHRVYRIGQVVYTGSSVYHYTSDDASCYVRHLGTPFNIADSVTLDNRAIDLHKTNRTLYLYK